MTTRTTRWLQAAPEGSVYAPDAFASSLNKLIPLKLGETPAGTGRLVAAEVCNGGRAVDLTVELPAAASTPSRGRPGPG